MATPQVSTVADPYQLDLAVSGMTCGACAMKVEKALNELDGVQASVNFATESARVTLDSSVSAAQ